MSNLFSLPEEDGETRPPVPGAHRNGSSLMSDPGAGSHDQQLMTSSGFQRRAVFPPGSGTG